MYIVEVNLGDKGGMSQIFPVHGSRVTDRVAYQRHATCSENYKVYGVELKPKPA